jgi:hypothetical protein
MLLTSNHALLEQAHFDRLALSWQRRALTLGSPGRRWASLQQSDAKWVSGLQLLQQLQKQSPSLGPDRLQEALMPGELFVLSLLALQLQDAPTWHACIAMAQALPRHQQALLATTQWRDAKAVQWALGQWPAAQTGTSELQVIFELHAAQLHPPVWQGLRQSQRWQKLSSEIDQAVPVLEAVLKLGLHLPVPELSDLAHKVMRRALGLQDQYLNLLSLSAELLMLLNRQGHAVNAYAQAHQALLDVARHGQQPNWAWQSSQVLACASQGPFQEVLKVQAQDPALQHVYLQGLGWSGRRHAVGPLMDALQDKRWAKTATASIMLITGSVPVLDGWEGHEKETASMTADVDAAIRHPESERASPQPDAQGFARWWQTHGGRITDGEVWLEGRALTLSGLAQTLHTGQLHARGVAARKLQWLQSTGHRLDTSWPGPVQGQWLQTHLPFTNPKDPQKKT